MSGVKHSVFSRQCSVFSHAARNAQYAIRNTLTLLWLLAIPSLAQPTNTVQPIDLPTTLRLAGAQNLDVQIARERLAEAKANHESAVANFFPWLAPGISFRQHDGKLQDVQGNIIDVHKHSYEPGAALRMQLDLGDALYKSLVTKQLATAAEHASEAERQDSVFAAAQTYFELALAQAAKEVSMDALNISSNYYRQTSEAVNAGLTFKGDALRVAVEKECNQLAFLQAREQQRVAAARLAQVLHLDPVVELEAQNSDLAPLAIIETNAALDSLVQQTLVSRPELKRNQSLVSAARDSKSGVVYGPLIPSVGAQGFFGGLGGGREGIPDTFGSQEDYALGIAWRLGPGGLFDVTRVHAADARLRIEDLTLKKLRDDVTRQTVEAFAHWQARREQIESAQHALEAAQEGLRLAEQRKEFAVGIVLENIQAEQDLTRARLDYFRAVAAFNQAQYALRKAIGKL